MPRSSDETTLQVQGLRHVPGEVGIWVFVFGELSIFGLLFAAFLIDRSSDVELYNRSQAMLEAGYGVANTILLVTSSVFVVMGVRALRSEAVRLAQQLFAAAFLCGLCFDVLKFVEYGEKLNAGISPYSNSFFMYYFMLTGFHFLHVTAGMVVLLFMIRAAQSLKRLPDQIGPIECGATYWHMVDLLWIVLFPLLYFVR